MPGSIRSRITRSVARARSFGITAAPDASAIDAVPRFFEVVRDELGDVVVVFDDKNMRH